MVESSKPALWEHDSPKEPSKGSSRSYTKIREIGQGTYGKAVLVNDREGKHYVMKVIDMSRMDSKQRKDSINEVKVLSSLKHPYVVSYRESYTENRNLVIIMDYADGGDLHQRIQKTKQGGKIIPEEKILRWVTEATLAMKYLHDKHVLHRDLKTQNLFLTAQDRLRIGDFGISKVLENTAAFARTTIGTPYYLSPEICLEKPYSYSSDVWALGCVLYELAALRVPFDAQTLQALVQKITRGPAPVMPANYTQELRQLCGDLLSREQSQRPTAQDILQRTLIQGEIRRMLREEQTKGSVNSRGGSGGMPVARSNSDAHSACIPLGRVASDGTSSVDVPRCRRDSGGQPPRMVMKTPSITSDEGRDDAVLSARFKGVGARVMMDDIGCRLRDPSPMRFAAPRAMEVPTGCQYRSAPR
mmetsp:Transcript_105327/g.298122  ORF Transcript_105327/g.298122 Transcript_105327/m.298122 type:complete len:416 (-) Transcript_105327:59-1306(-)